MIELKRKFKAFFGLAFLLLVMILFQNCSEFSENLKSTKSSVTDNPLIDENPINPVPVDQSLTPAFLAVGHQGSSMYSCDGGLSWEGYRALDPQRCDDPELDGNCDHQDLSGKGVVWTPSGFVLHYGHGGSGPVQRSENGNTWETLFERRQGGDIAYGNETLVFISSANPFYSDDHGTSWGNTIDRARFSGNVRAATFVPHGENGVFIVQTNGGGKSGISVSYDLGRSYSSAETVPSTCSTGGIAYNDTRIVMTSIDLCYSDDAGLNWTIVEGAPFNKNRLIHDGTEFKLFMAQSVYSSTDGITWSEEAILVDGEHDRWFSAANVTYHKILKKYVSIQKHRSHYEQTGFFHSSDGVNWTQVVDPGKKPSAPHPVRNIAAGYLKECAN